MNHPSSRSRKRGLAVVALVLAGLLVALPWIIANTPLRDQLLAAVINDDQLIVRSENASFGYLSPLWLGGLRIESTDRANVVAVERIESEKSWLAILFSRPQLGTFRFVRPSVNLLVDADSQAPEVDTTGQTSQLPELSAEIREAAVVVRTSPDEAPPIDIGPINLNVRLDRRQEQSILQIDPSTVFDHEPLTPQLCGRGLQLVAPLLADEIDAEGEFSLRLSEFEIPLGESRDVSQIRIAGELQLHRASVAMKNTIVTNVAALVLELIGRELPETMVVAEGVNVGFQVLEGRVHHKGLAVLLPQGDSAIGITSSGSVGLDESLDLQVSIELPAGLLGQSALARRLTGQPIVLAIGGTLDEPTVGLPRGASWVESIQRVISAGDDQADSSDSLEDAVTDMIGDLLQRAAERRPRRQTDQPAADQSRERRPLFPRLRQRLQDRREQEL